jgi:hypothetical protein
MGGKIGLNPWAMSNILRNSSYLHTSAVLPALFPSSNLDTDLPSIGKAYP